MLIRENENWVEMDAVDHVHSNPPACGDLKLSIAVNSNKFSGQAFAWIDASTFASFMQQLGELEHDRQGSAAMEGISPGAFFFRIWSIDRLGHVAIAGRIAKQVHTSDVATFQHAVEFGFEIDPTSLPKILAEFSKIAQGQTTAE
jgi:hypothetical protein